MSGIAVAGATGNVGRRVTARLLAEGVPVRALTRDLARARSVLSGSVDAVELRLDDPARLSESLAGCASLCLTCGNGAEQPAVEHALATAAAAVDCRIVKLSSVGAALDEQSHHRRLELAVEAAGAPCVHVRPSMFMQSILTLVEPDIRERGEVRLPLDAVEIDAVDLHDIADVAAAVLLDGAERAGALTLLGRRASMDAVADEIGARLSRPIRYVALGDEEAALGWARRGIDDGTVAMLLEIFATLRSLPAPAIGSDLERLAARPARSWYDAAEPLVREDGAWRDVNLVGGGAR